ncbi:molecular chaperone DnaJ [Nocardiopsis sp. YSL2]|nr:molecular chaperone DnaJ [Nocardiopsis sp. YSL2]
MKDWMCLDCAGTGRVRDREWGGWSLLVRKYTACGTCEGTGTEKKR